MRLMRLALDANHLSRVHDLQHQQHSGGSEKWKIAQSVLGALSFIFLSGHKHILHAASGVQAEAAALQQSTRPPAVWIFHLMMMMMICCDPEVMRPRDASKTICCDHCSTWAPPRVESRQVNTQDRRPRVSERRPIFWCKLPDKCARLNYCTASICGSARGRWQICQISHHYLIFYILNYDVYARIAICSQRERVSRLCAMLCDGPMPKILSMHTKQSARSHKCQSRN